MGRSEIARLIVNAVVVAVIVAAAFLLATYVLLGF
jgi:hypothetical protein